MPTPALQPFLDATGRIVHHLNTIVVGLSAVEAGTALKPDAMDITWSPQSLQTSSRQARSFALRSTLVFLAEEINAYLDRVTTYPGVGRTADWSSKDKSERLLAVWRQLGIDEDFAFSGLTLVGHWRNRIVHRRSNASLTSSQRSVFLAASDEVKSKYKGFDPQKALKDFESDTPTLKDVSSLTAIAIHSIRRLDSAVPQPQSEEEVKRWLVALGLQESLDRIRRVSAARGKKEVGVTTFLRTNCPELLEAYVYYCGNAD